MSTTVTGSKRHLNINADEFAGDLNGTVNTATTATTQSTSDNSTKVATTAFVKAQGYITTQSDTQDLSQSGNTVSLVNGGSVDISTTTAVAANTAKVSNVTQTSVSGNAGTVTNGVYLNTAQTITGAKTFNDAIKLQSIWDSSTLSNNSFYVQNSTDGFAFGVGTDISTWFTWDSTQGQNNAISCTNDGSKVTVYPNLYLNNVDTNNSGTTSLMLNSSTNEVEKRVLGSNAFNSTSIPSISGLASTSYVDTAVANVVDSSPAALNTLNELAAALGDDANYATTTATAIGTKLPLAGGTLTGNLTIDKVTPRLDFMSNESGTDVGGRLELNENGNFWLNAQGGRDLWLNWYSPNSPSSHADLAVGDGNSGSAVLFVDGSARKVGILKTNPSQALDVTGNILSSGTITGTTLTGTSLDINGNADMSGVLNFSKTNVDAESSENFFRIKFKDVGGVHNDVGIGQSASNNLGFNTTAGGTFTFNDGTNGNVLTISNGQATFDGEVEAASLDINGNADISGNLNVTGNITNATWAGDIIPEAKLQNQSGTNTGDQDLSGYLTSDTNYLKSNASDSFSGILTGTNGGENLKVGGIRGTAKGSQTGDYIHLYERVHVGGPSGWGASSHGAPGYGLSTWGSVDFGMNGTGVIQLDGTTVLTAARALTNITDYGLASADIPNNAANTTGDAGSVDGRHYQQHYGVGYKYDITIGGDSDKYYPVVIDGTWSYAQTINIQRSYSETAPNDWNTSTHKGGLTFQYQIIGSNGWGGYPMGIKVTQAAEAYSHLLGGIAFTAHGMKHVVWLRGGTAVYHVYCHSALTLQVNDSTSASNYVASSSPNAWITYDNSNASYVTTAAERTTTQANSFMETEIFNNMDVRYSNGKTNEVLVGVAAAKTFSTLENTQTFSGSKTFSALASFTMDGNTITGIDDSGEFTDNDAHIMTSAAVNDRIQASIIANTDTQDLSISGRAISLTNGGSVTVPAPTYSSVTGKPTTFAPTIGTTSTTALAGNTTIPSGSQLVKSFQNVDYIASGGTSGTYRNNYGIGLTVYEGYNGGANRPSTYDTTLQIMSTAGTGFELSADWVSPTTTPFKIRSLRDCCQGWNPWTEVYTENSFAKASVLNSNVTLSSLGAAASSHTHTYSSITGKPTTFAPTIGTTSTTAMAGNTSIPSAYSLPLSASGTRGGVKIGYSENGKNYPVELSSEKMYVNVPWTDNNTVYTHPTFNGDDFSVDTGALTGAVVVSDIDINVTTDTNGHVTDANGSVSTRTLTLANLGYTGATNANNFTYTHPTTAGNKHVPTGGAAGQFLKYSSSGTAVWATPSYIANTDTVYTHPTNLAGDDIDIDTGALTGATVISDLDLNITTNTAGHVTDANATVSTRNLTLANLGYSVPTTVSGSSGSCTGNAATATAAGTVTVTANSQDGSFYPTFVDGTSGYEDLKVDTGWSFNPSSNTMSVDRVTTATSTIRENNSNRAEGGVTGLPLMSLNGQGAGNAANISLHLAGDSTSSNVVKMRMTAVNGDDDLVGAGHLSYLATSDTFGIGQSTSHNQMAILIDNSDVVSMKNQTTFTNGIDVTSAVQSTSKTTGTVKIAGGLGVVKTLNVGEDVVAYASSDERYKDNLKPITNPIDKVKSLTGYTFTWNDKHEQFNGNDDIGVVAQEVEKVLPEIVDTRDNGYKAVKYEKMVALLIEAVKEQQTQIDGLKTIIDGYSK